MNYKLVPTLLTEPMSGVLRNEHCVYQTEQELYNALLAAAPAAPAELEPVDYMAQSGTCVSAEDVSYTPNWTDYYTTPLVSQSAAAAVISAKDAEIDLAADRLEVMEREHAEFFDRWHGERRRREKLVDDVERCYRMLLSEPNTKGALFKAENILREALADAKAATHNAKLTGSGTASAGLPGYAAGGNGERK